MTVIIDAHPLINRRVEQLWRIDFASRAGGQPAEGAEQVAYSPTARWRCNLTLIAIGAERAGWSAFIDSLRGRQRGVRLYPRACLSAALYARLGAPGPPAGFAGTPFSDGALFSDGAGFAWPAPAFTVAAAIDAFDDEVLLDMNGYSPGLTDGDFIGVNGWLKRIDRVLETESPTQMRLGVNPPFTVSISAGVEATARPSIVMRKMADEGGEVAYASRVARPSLDLVEIPGLV